MAIGRWESGKWGHREGKKGVTSRQIDGSRRGTHDLIGHSPQSQEGRVPTPILLLR